MNLNARILLGVAAAAGLAYFFTTSKGRSILSQVGENFSDLYSQGGDTIKSASEKVFKKGSEYANNIPQPFNV